MWNVVAANKEELGIVPYKVLAPEIRRR